MNKTETINAIIEIINNTDDKSVYVHNVVSYQDNISVARVFIDQESNKCKVEYSDSDLDIEMTEFELMLGEHVTGINKMKVDILKDIYEDITSH